MNMLKSSFCILFISFYLIVNLCSCSNRYIPSYLWGESDCENNIDGTKCDYLVDSIPYDTVRFVIIGKPKEKVFYYVPREYLIGRRKIDEKTLLNLNYAIFRYNYSNSMLQGPPRQFDPEEELRGQLRFVGKNIDGWQELSFSVSPSYLRCYLIRAEAFQSQFSRRWNYKCCLHKFPDMWAYYRVVVPLWKQK